MDTKSPKVPLPAELHLPQIEFAHNLLLQATRLRRKLNEALAEHCNISLSEKEILAHIHFSGGQVRMSEVSASLMFTDGGATKIIMRLVNRGFVTRERSEEDKRVILINITDEGIQKLFTAIEAMTSVALPVMSETYSTDECEALTDLLVRLEDRL